MHGLDDALAQHRLHSGPDLLFIVRLTPQYFFPRHRKLRLHEYQFVGLGGNVPAGLHQQSFRAFSVIQGSHILPVELDMEKVIPRLLKGSVTSQKQQTDKECKQCSLNICKPVLFMIIFSLFHCSSN